MNRTTILFIGAAVLAALGYVAYLKLTEHPTTATVADTEGDLGASVQVGNPIGPAMYVSNQPYLYPPPIAFIMPVTSGKVMD